MSKLVQASASEFLQNLAKYQQLASPAASVFLSPWWAEHYVSAWNPQVLYLQSQDPPCIFGRQLFRSRLGFQYRRIALNQSLEPRLESLTLEENGFFNVPNTLTEKFLPKLLAQLETDQSWDELRVSAASELMASAVFDWAKSNQLIAYEYASDETFWVDFSSLNQHEKEPFLNSRSANCRQQLRRAKRQIEEQLGTLSIKSATTVDQAIEWLSALGRLHQLRWPSTNSLEGFNNPFFTTYFQGLIQSGLLSGKVQILKISAAEKSIGYLFNLVKDGRVSFLMSGIDYHETEKYKPGLLCHWLAIEKNLSSGMQVYDFLNGANRYKESLATNRAVVKTITVARGRLGLRLEHLLRLRQRRRLPRI